MKQVQHSSRCFFFISDNTGHTADRFRNKIRVFPDKRIDNCRIFPRIERTSAVNQHSSRHYISTRIIQYFLLYLNQITKIFRSPVPFYVRFSSYNSRSGTGRVDENPVKFAFRFIYRFKRVPQRRFYYIDAQPSRIVPYQIQFMLMNIPRDNIAFVFHMFSDVRRLPSRRGANIKYFFTGLRVENLRN